MRHRIARNGDQLPRTEGQNIATQRHVLLVGDIHKIDFSFLEKFIKRDGQKTPVDHGEIRIQQADERHQMKNVVRPIPVG
jgi:hypothetical protein